MLQCFCSYTPYISIHISGRCLCNRICRDLGQFCDMTEFNFEKMKILNLDADLQNLKSQIDFILLFKLENVKRWKIYLAFKGAHFLSFVHFYDLKYYCFCQVNCQTFLSGNVPFKVITAIFNFYIPTTCMLVLYVKIFLAIKRRSKEMEKMTAFQGNRKNVFNPIYHHKKTFYFNLDNTHCHCQ